MKKILFTLSLLLSSFTAYALNCDSQSGTEITDINGTTYCKSKDLVDWWMADLWCEEQEGKLLTLADCVDDDMPVNKKICVNLVGADAGMAWTATDASQMGNSYRIDLGSGKINTASRNIRLKNNFSYAICK